MDQTKVAVIGAGVSGLSAAYHLLELWIAAAKEGGAPPRLDLRLVAPLTLDPDGDGSGLAGKAMSRSFTGPVDRHGLPRRLFYGPMLPHKGAVPHGYHILWEYPNLRRMLGAGAPEEPSPPLDGGLLRPPGGAGAIAVFQGNLASPTPGGPGIAVMGLSDPDRPETATRPATQALYRLLDTPAANLFLKPFTALFGQWLDDQLQGVHPLFFADLFYANEVDLEMRLALIVSSLRARRLDPEATHLEVDGETRPLYAVAYADYIASEVRGWAASLQKLLDSAPFANLGHELGARGWLLEAQIESVDLSKLERVARALLPDRLEDDVADLLLVLRETERILRALPNAALRLASGDYPLGRSLHLRFGPDATFTSPYEFDAAIALRSLAFVFTTPRSARAWTPDGAHIQRLWVRFWRRLEALAAAHPDLVTLTVEKGRVHSLEPLPGAGATDGAGLRVSAGEVLGHGFLTGPRTALAPGADLSYPHTHQLDNPLPPPAGLHAVEVDAVISGMAAPQLAEALERGGQRGPAAALAPLSRQLNATLELLIWTAERIEYSPSARRGLSLSALTGLEGGFCLLADYSQGLWSEEAYGAEDPFGTGRFQGSILESCGGFDDLFAALDRDDAYGWPAEVKAQIARLVARPEHYAQTDARPWPSDEQGWRDRRAGGTWTADRSADPAAMDDWWVAARWLAWQFLNQVSQVQSLGPRAVRQLAYYARLIDPRQFNREEILNPSLALRSEIRYVVMVNAKSRNRIFSPGLGQWPLRPVSGAPLPGTTRLFPAGDWTRNGLDIVCMEASCLSGMRAARGLYHALLGAAPPASAPAMTPVLPPASWYQGLDPLARPGAPIGGDDPGRSR